MLVAFEAAATAAAAVRSAKGVVGSATEVAAVAEFRTDIGGFKLDDEGMLKA